MLNNFLAVILIISIFRNTDGQVNPNDPEYFTPGELALLLEYKDRFCGTTVNSVDHLKYDPWFCVAHDNCNDVYPVRTFVTTEPCGVGGMSNTWDKCCFIGNIVLGRDKKPAFRAQQKYWGIPAPTKAAFAAYRNFNIKLFDDPEYFSSRELSLLTDYKDKMCAVSPNSVQPKKFDPWFCVKPENCDQGHNPVRATKRINNCNYYDTIEGGGSERCCFMGNIVLGKENKPAFTASEKYWGIQGPFKESFSSYTNYIYNHLDPDVREIYEENRICGLIPSDTRDVRNESVFTPYICWHMQCQYSLHTGYKTQFHKGLGTPEDKYYYHNGDRFCDHEARMNLHCCHPSVAVDYDKIQYRPQTIFSVNWKTKALPPLQKYAYGFRSSFQCEQYSRLACVENKDTCSLRVMDRILPVPGEFPHQALIGVQSDEKRFFHCSGSLVSRYFILSISQCIVRFKRTASIALLGDYDLEQSGEFGQHEVLSLLSEVFTEPYERGQPPLALFRLWRPVTPHPWLRPACIDWRSNFQPILRSSYKDSYPDATPNANLTFSGFGTNAAGGQWNAMLKRFNVSIMQTSLETCINTILPLKYRQTIVSCNTLDPAPSEFDLGGAASTMDPKFAPYCMWRLYGVFSWPRNQFKSTAFRIVNSAMPWIEDVIWNFDMDLFQFDVSMPKCHNKRRTNFLNMLHTF